MTRQDAERKVRALRQMTVERGATPAEAKTAARMVKRLTDAYGLQQPRATPPPRRPPQPSMADVDMMRAAFQRMRPGVFEVLANGWFNPRTGKHADNVKVHHYRDRGNWRIEVF